MLYLTLYKKLFEGYKMNSTIKYVIYGVGGAFAVHLIKKFILKGA